ncbi:phosphatidylglycerophosphatase A [Sneathiella sp.]|uniref:phosphatidylglycerophosphatase A family protein n=1 Tax=Sneathiella sp. TaxID=1964365 RepID=UPI003569E04A
MTALPFSRTHPAFIWSTWFWSGLAPKAPGTFGSLAALPVGVAILYFFGAPILGLAAVFIFFTGWWSSAIYLNRTGKSDPGEIVIDEVAGLWLALHAAENNLLLIALAFGLFRLFDIWKPWPIRWLDRKVKGAFGVMIDDVVAGLFAAFVLAILKWGYYGHF